MFKEFKEFALRGNVMDMAIGIIIGAAFNKIVTSLVNDVIMPPIGKLLGNADFSQLFVNLTSTTYETLAQADAAGAPTLKYGMFFNTVIDFIIIAFTIFVVVKLLNRLKRQEQAKPAPIPPQPSQEAQLLTEIRDLLKTR